MNPVLPTFAIIGERRSGTTTLAKWVECHPDLYMHPHLDLSYFIDDPLVARRTWMDGECDPAVWDAAHEPREYAFEFSAAGDKAAVGEKSADYLFWRPAHARMRRFTPDAHYVAVLRHPVNRAWSHYWNEVGKGRETLSFEEAVRREEERSKQSAYARLHLSYVARGFYDESLKDFFHHIPPGRLLVLTTEGLQKNPRESLSAVYAHLGVDPEQGLDRAGVRYNANWATVPRAWTRLPGMGRVERALVKRIRKASLAVAGDRIRGRRLHHRIETLFRKPATGMVMPEEVRAQLTELYAPHVAALTTLLGRDFPEWS